MSEQFLSFLDEFRASFRLADAIDILLISVLVYSVLIWFRETASRRVVSGVSLLAAVYFLARALDLYLTLLAFHTGFAVLLVILIVVFQEDLRRTFERIAVWGSLRRRLRPVEGFLLDVDTLVETAFALAAMRTGALVVLKGKEPLERHLDGGVRLGGELSQPLLCSIFDASSPGHDGAVVLGKNRVEWFAAHLPISKNHVEIAGRGTRHSAALGLSECSDALVVVVSEERGVVSVAEAGRLHPAASAAVLKDRIEEFLRAKFPQKTPDFWTHYVFQHLGLKILALVLAAGTWFTLAYNPSTIQRTFVVPIEYRNLPANLVLDEAAPDEARVTLSGSERNFRFLEPGSLRISMDLGTAQGDAEEFTISQRSLKLPPNLEVYRIEPRILRLYLRRRAPDVPGNGPRGTTP